MSGILVLGLGNVLLQDDGLGVHAVEEMHRRYHLPDHVQVLDGGVRGLSLLPYLESVSHLLLIDAIDAGDIPGALVCFTAEELSWPLAPACRATRQAPSIFFGPRARRDAIRMRWLCGASNRAAWT